MRTLGLAISLSALLVSCSGGSGGGGGLSLLQIRWGKLVDVRDATGALVARDLVAEEGVHGNSLEYALASNLVTERATVTVFAALGTTSFASTFASLADSLGFVIEKHEASPPPYSMVPRNAVLLLSFDRSVEPSSVGSQTIRIFAGATELEARRFVDPSDARRVVVDPAISPIEAQATGLSPNDLGLPPSDSATIANIQLRIPTRIDPSTGQTQVLRSASGGSIEDDPVVPGVSDDGTDLVRVFRSGGPTSITGDPNDGFLADLDPPEFVGTQAVTIASVANAPGGRREVAFGFDVESCAIGPDVGDVIEQSDSLGVIVAVTSGNPAIVLVEDASASAAPPMLEPGPALFHTPFEPQDAAKAACFLTFLPAPDAPPAGGVDPAAVVRLRFSEPMDPETVQAFDTVTLTFLDQSGFAPAILLPTSLAVGEWADAEGSREFTFVPSAPFPHQASSAELVRLRVVTGTGGVTDASGNALAVPLFEPTFSLDPSAPSAETAGFSLRFDSLNETNGVLGPPDVEGKPEVGGQVVWEPGRLRGRTVLRFSRAADLTSPFVAAGPLSNLPSYAPLTPYGSRLMTLWRHLDLGVSLQNPAEVNLDVERLSWAPFLGAPAPGGPGVGQLVAADTLARLRIDLSHSYFFPDEFVDPSSFYQLAQYAASGLSVPNFHPTIGPPASGGFGSSGNPFAYWGNPATEAPAGPPLTVYDGPYTITPSDLYFVPGSNTPRMPYPPLATTYTWRDSGFPYGLKGGPLNGGVEPLQWEAIYGPGSRTLVAQTGKVPSIALPLLLDYRTYPLNPVAPLGQNLAQMVVLNNGYNGYSGPSYSPKLRLFSHGGFNNQGTLVVVDPDANAATGGLNPASIPPGLPTLVADARLYLGQVDFVVRITRAFTHWFDTGATPNVTYGAPVVEPRPSSLPPGTLVLVEFRGADLVTGPCPLGISATGPASEPLEDASDANLYGVYTTGNPAGAVTSGFPIGGTPCDAHVQGVAPPFASNPSPYQPEWTADLSALNGKRFLQMRFTFVGNIDTEDVPSLSAVGIAYFR